MKKIINSGSQMYSLLIYLNKNKLYLVIIIFFALIISSILVVQKNKSSFCPSWLYLLLSSDESNRFKGLEIVRQKKLIVSEKCLKKALTNNKDINVSALIFILTEKNNELLYNLSSNLKKIIEQSNTSFPNIAYYYAKVSPDIGIAYLFELYNNFKKHHLYICKAIGIIKSKKAIDFLIKKAVENNNNSLSIKPQLSGLIASKQNIKNSIINQFLGNNLSVDEIIMLARVKTNIEQNSIKEIYLSGQKQRLYAIEYILNNIDDNFDIFKEIVLYEMKMKNYNYIKIIFMSDKIRRSSSQNLKIFIDKIQNEITQ